MKRKLSYVEIADIEDLIQTGYIDEAQVILNSSKITDFSRLSGVLVQAGRCNKHDVFKNALSKIGDISEVLKKDSASNKFSFLDICRACISSKPQNIEAFKILKEIGVPLKENMDALLKEIANHNQTHIAEYLVEIGGQFNTSSESTNIPPLAIAIYSKNEKTALFLIEHGVDVQLAKTYLKRHFGNLIKNIETLEKVANAKKEKIGLNNDLNEYNLKPSKNFKL